MNKELLRGTAFSLERLFKTKQQFVCLAQAIAVVESSKLFCQIVVSSCILSLSSQYVHILDLSALEAEIGLLIVLPCGRSAWLPEENISLIAVAAEKVAFCLVDYMRSKVLTNNAVPWFTCKMEQLQLKYHLIRFIGLPAGCWNLPCCLSNSSLILLAITFSSLCASKVARIS